LTQSLPQTYRRNAAEGERRAARIHTLAQTAYAELRNLLHQLAPTAPGSTELSQQSRAFLGLDRLHSAGLGGALTHMVSTMAPESLKLSFDFERYVTQDIAHEEELYRVCQEAVSNVIRHARAGQLWVSATVSERIVSLKIADNGCGMEKRDGKSHSGLTPAPKPNGAGMGLRTMQSRVSGIGGVLRITPRTPGVALEVALPRKDRAVAP
jgi:signal transduction histidine kinase